MLPLNQLYNMNCMEGMAQFPDKYFSLAIVDPPYGIGNCINTHGKKLYKKMNWNNSIPSEAYFIELLRISQHQIIWGCNYYSKYISSTGRIVHDKTNNKQFNGPNTLSDADLASQSFNNLIKIFHYGWSGNRMGNKINWNNNGVDSRFHPTQKPIALYKWLLHNYAKPDYKIIDTHAGSCSSVIAFLDYGCDWIAFEIDKDYYEAASNRIEIHKQQLKLF